MTRYGTVVKGRQLKQTDKAICGTNGGLCLRVDPGSLKLELSEAQVTRLDRMSSTDFSFRTRTKSSRPGLDLRTMLIRSGQAMNGWKCGIPLVSACIQAIFVAIG